MAILRVNVGESGGCEQDKASVDDSGSLWWRPSPFWRKLCARIPRKSTPGPSKSLPKSSLLPWLCWANSKSLFHLFLGYGSSSASSSRAAVEFFIDSRSMREVMVLPAVEFHQTSPPSWQKNLTECEDLYCLSFLERKNPSTLCVLLPELPRMQNLQPCVCCYQSFLECETSNLVCVATRAS